MKIRKFSSYDIHSSLSDLDLHCSWLSLLPKHRIGFDDDPRGNGNGPYLELTCYDKYVKFTSGTHLRSDEKKVKYNYSDFNNVDDFCDYLAKFVIEYFTSIKVKLVRIR